LRKINCRIDFPGKKIAGFILRFSFFALPLPVLLTVHESEVRMAFNLNTQERWPERRKKSGLLIDPETAEVGWIYTVTRDPYGVCSELPEEHRALGEIAGMPRLEIGVPRRFRSTMT
jgi:hypothetical protein